MPEIARKIISENKVKDIDAIDTASETAFHYAAKNGDITTMKLLLQKGANINAQNYNNETPLHLAIKFLYSLKEKGKATIEFLLQYSDERIKDVYNCTAFQCAVRTWDLDIIKLFTHKHDFALDKGMYADVFQQYLIPNSCINQLQSDLFSGKKEVVFPIMKYLMENKKNAYNKENNENYIKVLRLRKVTDVAIYLKNVQEYFENNNKVGEKELTLATTPDYLALDDMKKLRLGFQPQKWQFILPEMLNHLKNPIGDIQFFYSLSNQSGN